MIITPHPLDFAELGIGVSRGHRSPGLHMSQIYGSLFSELDPKRFPAGGTPDPLRLEAGLAFEDFLEEGLKRRLRGERPDEFTTSEGVIFSPDLIIFNGHTRLGEMKLSWLSSREMPKAEANGLPPKMDKWLVQMKSYCYHLETPYARLIAFFVNGDYRPPRPELLAYDIEFTKRELDENWKMLLQHAKDRRML